MWLKGRGLICAGGAPSELTESDPVVVVTSQPHIPSSSGIPERSPQKDTSHCHGLKAKLRVKEPAHHPAPISCSSGQPSLLVHLVAGLSPVILPMPCQGCHGPAHSHASLANCCRDRLTDFQWDHDREPLPPPHSPCAPPPWPSRPTVTGACSQMGHCSCPLVKAIPFPQPYCI